MSDPCHGNTAAVAAAAGADVIKTRCATTMLDEARQTWAVHRALGSCLGGLHLEQTGEEGVVECVEHMAGSGTRGLSLSSGGYRTLCDPRLSREQAMGFVERFAEFVVGEEEDEEEEVVLLPAVGAPVAAVVGGGVEGKKEMVEKIAVVVVENYDDDDDDGGFVADHPEELAAFAYQPPPPPLQPLPLLPLVV
ncbi:MAG: hypothetical protein LQ352_008428 [Teloschistes flavicans]|nr:MAG: hypothetical protein LQ352_008428 [Teloschistes flavicans]